MFVGGTSGETTAFEEGESTNGAVSSSVTVTVIEKFPTAAYVCEPLIVKLGRSPSTRGSSSMVPTEEAVPSPQLMVAV